MVRPVFPKPYSESCAAHLAGCGATLSRGDEPSLASIEPRPPRSRGAVRVTLKAANSRTVLDTLYQSGCLRLRIPRTEKHTQTESVLINTAGGLTGGDDLYIESHWLAGTTACLTTQAAEKIYRAANSVARVRTRLFVESGANAEWLPQETILFNRSALDRRLDVNLARGAKFLGLETVVFGRQA